MTDLKKSRRVGSKKITTYDELLEDIMSYKRDSTKFKTERELKEWLTGEFDTADRLKAPVKGSKVKAGYYIVEKSKVDTIVKYVDYMKVKRTLIHRTSSKGKEYTQESYRLEKNGRFIKKDVLVKGESGGYFWES